MISYKKNNNETENKYQEKFTTLQLRNYIIKQDYVVNTMDNYADEKYARNLNPPPVYWWYLQVPPSIQLLNQLHTPFT